jgi:nitrogenase molybdenum-iron protein NifN
MAAVIQSRKPVTVDPLRHSAPLGAVLAFLGVARCMPLLHSSQGCAAFVKVLLTRHFRESIPLQTSALTEVTTILGSGDSLLAAIATVTERQQPAVIGVITTGLVDAAGEDVRSTLRQLPPGPLVVLACVPDLGGGLEQGYAAAVEALVAELALPRAGAVVGGRVVHDQVTVLPGPALGPLDVEELRTNAEACGLRTVVLPDPARSLDGHLDDDWEPLLSGGTALPAAAAAGRSAGVLAVGSELAYAGRMLAGARPGPQAWTVPHAVGLDASDALVGQLAAVAGRDVPEVLRRWRSRLTDGLLDASGVLAGRRVALALEPDALAGVTALLTQAGCRVVTAVTPSAAGHLRELPCAEVVVGDFEDAEERARDAGAELLVASSHGAAAAQRLGIPLLRFGFPVVDRLGAQHLTSVGYRGSLRLLFAVANRLLAVSDGPPVRTLDRREPPC